MFNNARQSIPKLFQLIMKNDRAMAELVSLPVIPLKLYKEGRERRLQFIQAAEKYVARQKKGND